VSAPRISFTAGVGVEPSLMVAQLAEPSKREEELEKRLQELENVQNLVVTGIVIVENSGGEDHDKNAASSSSGRKGRKFWIGAAVALLLAVGVILGVAIPLTSNNDDNEDSQTMEPATTPTQSPAPTQSLAPTACTSLDCLVELLLQNDVSDAEALQDESSPQYLALRWLAQNDTMVLDLDTRTSLVNLVQRYVLAVLYFATSSNGGLNVLNFLTASSVCQWNDGGRGVFCNRDGLVTSLTVLSLGKWSGFDWLFVGMTVTLLAHSSSLPFDYWISF
jgi:hypothetical protein